MGCRDIAFPVLVPSSRRDTDTHGIQLPNPFPFADIAASNHHEIASQALESGRIKVVLESPIFLPKWAKYQILAKYLAKYYQNGQWRTCCTSKDFSQPDIYCDTYIMTRVVQIRRHSQMAP